MIIALSDGTAGLFTSGISCLFFVLFCISISQAALLCFNLLRVHNKLQRNNEVAGIMFGAISLIYSLILAFVIIAVWGDYEDLDKTIQSEADKLNSIMAHSSTLPGNLKKELNTAIYNYCDQV